MPESLRVILKGILFGLAFGAGAGLLFFWVLGAGSSVSTQTAIAYGAIGTIGVSAGTLWLLRSPRGQLLRRLGRVRRPSPARMGTFTGIWVLVFGLAGLARYRIILPAIAAGVAFGVYLFLLVLLLIWLYRRELEW